MKNGTRVKGKNSSVHSMVAFILKGKRETGKSVHVKGGKGRSGEAYLQVRRETTGEERYAIQQRI